MAKIPDYAENNHWMNLLQINGTTYGTNREGLMARLEKNGIQTRPVWALNHKQKPYQDCQSYKVDRAEELVNNSLCLPSSTSLSDDQIYKVMDSLHG
jgi:dTDP-4-amino-4,6-dideoxygalactose transaminase